MCKEPNPKCQYYKKYNCCGYCSKCPPERRGLKDKKEIIKKPI